MLRIDFVNSNNNNKNRVKKVVQTPSLINIIIEP